MKGDVVQQRILGRSGLKVSAIGLGCMGMSEFYGPHDDEESVRTIQHALDIGTTFLDTSNTYGRGHNEELVGRAIRDRRQEVVLATKFGILRYDDGTRGVDGRPEYARAACEESLRRLKVDVIDLYYLHRVDHKVPIEETVGAMRGLVEEGKVRYLGLSEASPETLRRAAAVAPIAALQTEYSLWTRDPEGEVLGTCRELGIGFVAYCPLGRGFLTGRFRSPDDLAEDDWRRQTPRFQADNFTHNLDLVRSLEEMAEGKGCTPGQLALAWVLAQGENLVPIPGTKRASRLDENAAAVEFSLSEQDLQRLNQIMPSGAAAGPRYPPSGMKKVNG